MHRQLKSVTWTGKCEKVECNQHSKSFLFLILAEELQWEVEEKKISTNFKKVKIARKFIK